MYSINSCLICHCFLFLRREWSGQNTRSSLSSRWRRDSTWSSRRRKGLDGSTSCIVHQLWRRSLMLVQELQTTAPEVSHQHDQYLAFLLKLWILHQTAKQLVQDSFDRDSFWGWDHAENDLNYVVSKWSNWSDEMSHDFPEQNIQWIFLLRFQVINLLNIWSNRWSIRAHLSLSLSLSSLFNSIQSFLEVFKHSGPFTVSTLHRSFLT